MTFAGCSPRQGCDPWATRRFTMKGNSKTSLRLQWRIQVSLISFIGATALPVIARRIRHYLTRVSITCHWRSGEGSNRSLGTHENHMPAHSISETGLLNHEQRTAVQVGYAKRHAALAQQDLQLFQLCYSRTIEQVYGLSVQNKPSAVVTQGIRNLDHPTLDVIGVEEDECGLEDHYGQSGNRAGLWMSA